MNVGRGIACLLMFTFSATALVSTQTVTLRPGWNSVHLEVEPVNPDPSALFAGVPIETVWTYSERLTAVEFIQNANEPLWNRSSWRMFTPTNQPGAFQNSLFKILGNRPYLIHLTNTVPYTMVITGRPSFRPASGVPDAYNLRGFSVDSASPPTFLNFFRCSSAHYDAASGSLNKIYRLNSLGNWQLVAPGDLMQSGVAYWVFCRGGSDYMGPVTVRVDYGDGLDFASTLSEQTITFESACGGAAGVTIQNLAGAGSPLSHPVTGTNGVSSWAALPGVLGLSLQGGQKSPLTIALDRPRMPGTNFATIFEISDGNGFHLRLPVTGSKLVASGQTGGPPPNTTEEARSRAGLWVGTVTLNAVAEVNSGTLVTNAATMAVTRVGMSTNPTPTRSELSLRLLLHVDTNGTASLLKEVIQMWKEGSNRDAGNGFQTNATPGQFVLLTDDALLTQFQGAALRDGQSVGRRLSTASYDWQGTNTFMPMTGRLAVSNSLSCTLSLQPNSPTNPFRHKFHPDHDNLNARYDGFKQEAYPVTRQINLLIAGPGSSTTPDYGYASLAGTYREVLTGLHKQPLYVSGNFQLTRVSTTGVLNQ